MSTTPRVMVHLLPSYSYRIEIAEPDMLSLAFRFEPVFEPRVDKTGLGRPAASQAMPTEESLGIALADGMSAVQDVDQLLANDGTLMWKVTEQSAKVLETARYSRERYLAWLKETPTFGDPARKDKGVVSPKPA